MKNLANYIIKNMNTSESWNEKFYQPGGVVEIYIDSKKHDVTDLFNDNLNEDGMFVRSEFDAIFTPQLEEMMDRELDEL